MTIRTTVKNTILLALVWVVLLQGHPLAWATSELNTPKINRDAFVYILNMGLEGGQFHYQGLRNGFTVGNGQYILTAAHCVADFETTNTVLRQPIVISPYYGDIFEAEIIVVDDVNDIAILKPNWKAHPALKLETSEEWKKCETLKVVGYPPTESSRGGNGSTGRIILSEEVPLRYSSGKNAREVVVGPCHYPGVGWSGSPFINPETGKVVGIFCRGDTYQSKKYIFFKKKEKLHSGPGIDSIRELLKESGPDYNTTTSTMENINHRHRFERILATLDVFQPNNKQKVEDALRDLCDELPNSYLVNILAGPAFEDPNNLSHFENAIKIAPESIYARATYGNYLRTCNLPQKAAEQFQIVTEREPNHFFACHGLLSTQVQTDPNSAEILGKELIERWPENAGFHFEYSKALRANNKRKEELPVIQKAIELSEENDIPFTYQRYLADSFEANKHYKQAKQAYCQLLEKHECDRCWWAYTTLLLKMGPEKVEQAKKALDKTITFIQDPNKILEIQQYYERSVEKILGDPNTAEQH